MKKTEDQKILERLVKKEARNLRKLATKKELRNLRITKLNSENSMECVYGQMTGDCFSSRAQELIVSCCEKVYDSTKTINGGISSDNNIANSPLNGKPDRNRRDRYWSPIEVFIARNSEIFKGDSYYNDGDPIGYTAKDNENNKRLLRYLKGNTDSLTFV